MWRRRKRKQRRFAGRGLWRRCTKVCPLRFFFALFSLVRGELFHSMGLETRLDSVRNPCACPTTLGVLRLVSLGHSASAIASFDEAWALADWLRPWLERVTGNAPLGDWLAFYVSASHAPGFTPHRDRPRGTLAAGGFRAPCPRDKAAPPLLGISGGPSSGASSGESGTCMPKYTAVWVALSDATPNTSRLYFLPKPDDPMYFGNSGGDGGGDDEVLEAALPSAAAWASVVCAPAAKGRALVFSQRMVHWGSKPQAGTGPGK